MRRHGEIHDFRPTAIGRALGADGAQSLRDRVRRRDGGFVFRFHGLLKITDLSFAVPGDGRDLRA